MDFEDAKENIQPLASGRNASVLACSLTSHSELQKQRDVLEAAIRNYEGSDPLEPWYEYILWIEQSYPSGGNESGLKKVLLKCLMTFEENKNYYQDRRMIRIFIKYIDTEENPCELYQELFNSGIGTMIADLYICWAYYYDLAGNFQKADSIFKKGLELRAQPYDELEQAHKHFGFTMSQRILHQDETSKAEFMTSMKERRNALTSLRPHKKKVGSIRTGSAVKNSNPGKIRLNEEAGNASTSHRSNLKVEVFEDQNKDPNFPQEPINPEEHHIPVVRNIIDSARKQENLKEPGPWTKGLKKKGSLFGNTQTHNHEMAFTILEDEKESENDEEIEKIIGLPKHPDNYSKGIILPPNFARKNYPQGIWKVETVADNEIQAKVIAKYSKFYCYPKPGVEFSPEEVRAYYWFKRTDRKNKFTEINKMYFENEFSVGCRLFKNFPKRNLPDKTKFEVSKFELDFMPNAKFAVNIKEIYPGIDTGTLGEEKQIEEIIYEKIKSGQRKIKFDGDETICFEEQMDETQCFTNIVGRKSIFPSRKSMAPFGMDRKTIFKPSVEEQNNLEDISERSPIQNTLSKPGSSNRKSVITPNVAWTPIKESKEEHVQSKTTNVDTDLIGSKLAFPKIFKKVATTLNVESSNNSKELSQCAMQRVNTSNQVEEACSSKMVTPTIKMNGERAVNVGSSNNSKEFTACVMQSLKTLSNQVEDEISSKTLTPQIKKNATPAVNIESSNYSKEFQAYALQSVNTLSNQVEEELSSKTLTPQIKQNAAPTVNIESSNYSKEFEAYALQSINILSNQVGEACSSKMLTPPIVRNVLLQDENQSKQKVQIWSEEEEDKNSVALSKPREKQNFDIFTDESHEDIKNMKNPAGKIGLDNFEIYTDPDESFKFKQPHIPVKNVLQPKIPIPVLDDDLLNEDPKVSNPQGFEADETCSTQAFNLFIRAQSISTPIGKKSIISHTKESSNENNLYTERNLLPKFNIAPETEQKNCNQASISSNSSNSANSPDFAVSSQIAQEPVNNSSPYGQEPPPYKQLSTIMETSETNTLPTTSTKSSVDTQVSSVEELENRKTLNDPFKTNKSNVEVMSLHKSNETHKKSIAENTDLRNTQSINNTKSFVGTHLNFSKDAESSNMQSESRKTITDIFKINKTDTDRKSVHSEKRSNFCLENTHSDQMQNLKENVSINKSNNIISSKLALQLDTEESNETNKSEIKRQSVINKRNSTALSNSENNHKDLVIVDEKQNLELDFSKKQNLEIELNLSKKTNTESFLKTNPVFVKIDEPEKITQKTTDDTTQHFNMKSIQIFEEKTETVPKFILKRQANFEEPKNDLYNFFVKTPERSGPAIGLSIGSNPVPKSGFEINDTITFSNLKELTLPKLPNTSKFLIKDSPVSKVAKFSFIKTHDESVKESLKTSINSFALPKISFEEQLPTLPNLGDLTLPKLQEKQNEQSFNSLGSSRKLSFLQRTRQIDDENKSSEENGACFNQDKSLVNKNNSKIQQLTANVHHDNTEEGVSCTRMQSLVISEIKGRDNKTQENEQLTFENEDDLGKSIYLKHSFKTPTVPKHYWTDMQDDEYTDENFIHNRSVNLDQTNVFINEKIMEADVNPFSSELTKAFLEKIGFSTYLSELETCELKGKLSVLNKGNEITIKGTTFIISKIIGEGAFGTIYSAKEKSTGKLYAMKQEKPANLWEYYICLELRSRINNVNILPGFIDIEYGLIGNNASILVSEYSPYGSLITICNTFKRKTTKNLDEYVVMILTTQILAIIDHLHASEIIHADVKPDNFLLMSKLSWPINKLAVQLIDFGISIDMQLFPKNQTFTYSHTTEDYKCIEMLQGRPWTYQTDLYGLAGTIHVLLYGKYMEVEKNLSCLWAPKHRIPRYINKSIWEPLFQNLLNVRDCNTMPNLQRLRTIIEQILADKEKYVIEKVNEFNLCLQN